MRRQHRLQVLCSRLLAIEYIDLAEQSLQALEKLSHEHPQVLFLKVAMFCTTGIAC